MNTLKTGLIALSFFFIGTGFSQQSNAAERANAHTERLAKELSLSAEQKTKVSELNTGIERKNEAISSNPNLTPEQKKEHMQGNNNARRAQLKMILTEEQYNKYTTTIEPSEVHRENVKKEVEK